MSCCIGHIFYSRLKALLTLSTSPCPARYPPGSLRIMRCSCLCSSSCHAHDLLTNSSLCIVIGSLSVFQALRFGLHLSSTNDAFICDALSKFRAIMRARNVLLKHYSIIL